MELKELKFISAMDVSAIATITQQMFPFCFASIAERFIRVLTMDNRGRNAIKKATSFHKKNKVLQVRHTLWLISLPSLTVRPRREVSCCKVLRRT